ncbi:MAG: hypothetical protein ACR2LA_01415, partial [Acidimicrobiales bacterium]
TRWDRVVMDADRRGAHDRRERWVLVLFVVIALVPIVGAAIRLGGAGWLPEGDDAMIARRTMSVFSTEPPVTGQPSTAGNLFTTGSSTGDGAGKPAAQIDASHPGPLEYYLLAVPYRIGGWTPGALLAAVALVNGTCVVVAVVFAWRRLGAVGALAGTLAVLVVAERLGTWNLARPLNASIAVFPLLAGMVATWAALDGDRWAMVAAAACLSLVIQAHLGAAPLGAVILLVAVIGPPLLWRVARRPAATGATTATAARGDGSEGATRGWRVPLVAAAGVLAVAWAIVAVEQVTAERGNVGRLADVARLDVDRAGLRFAVAAVADLVARPVWPGVDPLPRISILGPIALVPAVVQGSVLVALLGTAAWWARRSQNRWLTRLLAVVAVAIVVPILVLARGPEEVRLGPAYQLTSLVAVSALAAFALSAALAAAIAPHLRARLGGRDHRRFVAVVGGVAAVAALATTVFGGETQAEDSHRTARLADAIRAELPKGTYRLSAQGTWAYLSTLDAVSVDLLRHGYDIRVVRLGTIPAEPQRRDTDVDAPTIIVDSKGQPPPDARLLVRLGPSSTDPTWAGELLAAVSEPEVSLRINDGAGGAGTPACVQDVVRTARGGTAATRRRVVLAILSCSQGERRQALAQVSLPGLDRFWVDLLGSNMPAPFPRSGLSAYLQPAPDTPAS